MTAPTINTETQAALNAARQLATNGVPIFLLHPALDHAGRWEHDGGHGSCGYWIPRGWERTKADPAVMDHWQPGMAVAAVTGHGIDLVDSDPRSGGDDTLNGLHAAGIVPTTYAEAATPSGGWHGFVASLGVRSLDGVAPGVDIKAGVDGQGHGFAFLAPTVRLSKDTGELVTYRWTTPPDLVRWAAEAADDDSGEALADMVKAAREGHAKPSQDGTGDLTTVDNALAAGPWDDIPGTLANGRHHAIHKLASALRGRGGWRVNDAVTFMGNVVWPHVDQTQSGHPYTWAEMEANIRDVFKRYEDGSTTTAGAGETPDGETGDKPDHRGQLRMAYRLADTYAGRLLHVHGLGWHAWTGTRWTEDERGAAHNAVYNVLRKALAESLGDRELQADVRKCESANGVSGVLQLAAAIEPFAATVNDLDQDGYLLNCSNGTLDLRTGELRPHDPHDLITKVTRASYDPQAHGVAWEAFLASSLPDVEVREFLRRYVGVGLAGTIREHVLAILTGEGRNGKGVFYEAVANALGDYATSAEPDLFMHREGAHPTGEMDLRGTRWVVVSESDKGRKLAEATVKRLTGGDKIRARRMRKDFVEFDASHTAALVTNHLPKVSGDDPALWARLRVVPFDVVFSKTGEPRQDGDLKTKLQVEIDAVLAWAVTGWWHYRQHGLAEPTAVVKATADYKTDSDTVARFIAERCTTHPHLNVRVAELSDTFAQWCLDEGAELVSKRAFGEALDKAGFPSTRGTGGARYRAGIRLKTETEDDE